MKLYCPSIVKAASRPALTFRLAEYLKKLSIPDLAGKTKISKVIKRTEVSAFHQAFKPLIYHVRAQSPQQAEACQCLARGLTPSGFAPAFVEEAMIVQDRGHFSVVTSRHSHPSMPMTEKSRQNSSFSSGPPHNFTDTHGFIGQSAAMTAIYDLIARMGVSRASVFITGESGTGKEVTAQALHQRSGRAGRMIALNCSAIPRDLIESEIFGHVKGAFTGAHDERIGAAELAHGGTLFLDEICEMDLSLQAKLLRFIQTGEVRRLGDTRVRQVDVRFVCATNRQVEEEVAQGRFREDLYYRLCVLPIQLPPLRKRGDDAVLLARHFLTLFAEEEGRAFTRFDAAAESLIQRFDWPGNVRQLQNVIRRLVVMNEGEVATAAMLPLALAHGGAMAQPFEKPAQSADVLPFWMQEKQIIENALSCYGGNMAKAAAALELNPSTLYRKREQWARQTLAALHLSQQAQ